MNIVVIRYNVNFCEYYVVDNFENDILQVFGLFYKFVSENKQVKNYVYIVFLLLNIFVWEIGLYR